MDERVQIDAKLSVEIQAVKNVVLKVVNDGASAVAVQSVLPRGLLEEGILPKGLDTMIRPLRPQGLPKTRRQIPVSSKKALQTTAVDQVDRLPIYQSPIDGLLICFQPGDLSSFAPIVICMGLLGWIQGRGFMKVLPESQPIYAMQAPELLSGNHGESFTIRERAWRFFQALRRNFPATGVHLFGGSYGGPLSAEIALCFQTAGIPFTLMMHDPLPAVAAPQSTEDVARRALDYGFLFSVLSRTKQLTAKTRKIIASVQPTWFDETTRGSQSVAEFDQAVKQLLGVDQAVFNGLMNTMSVMAEARESLSTLHLKTVDVINAPVTVFTMSEGGAFFAEFFGYAPHDCEASYGYGWSSFVAEATIVELKGGHLEGLGNESAMAAVSQHLQKLVAAHPLQYKPVRVHKPHDSIVTRVELVSDSMTDHMVQEIISALEPGRLHVFTSACADFCTGWPARAGLEREAFVDSIEGSTELLRELESLCDLPIITVCQGKTCGVGALFGAVSDIVLATSDATFVLSEVGAVPGAVPGVAAIALARRLDEQQCRTWTQTGDAMEASVALTHGLVDLVSTTHGAATQELENIIQATAKIPVEMLRARKRIASSSGNSSVALVETGKAMFITAGVHAPTDVDNSNLARTQWHDNGVAVVELLNQEGEAIRCMD